MFLNIFFCFSHLLFSLHLFQFFKSFFSRFSCAILSIVFVLQRSLPSLQPPSSFERFSSLITSATCLHVFISFHFFVSCFGDVFSFFHGFFDFCMHKIYIHIVFTYLHMVAPRNNCRQRRSPMHRIYSDKYIFTYRCIHIHVHICIYIYVYTYIYMYAYLCTLTVQPLTSSSSCGWVVFLFPVFLVVAAWGMNFECFAGRLEGRARCLPPDATHSHHCCVLCFFWFRFLMMTIMILNCCWVVVVLLSFLIFSSSFLLCIVLSFLLLSLLFALLLLPLFLLLLFLLFLLVHSSCWWLMFFLLILLSSSTLSSSKKHRRWSWQQDKSNKQYIFFHISIAKVEQSNKRHNNQTGHKNHKSQTEQPVF